MPLNKQSEQLLQAVFDGEWESATIELRKNKFEKGTGRTGHPADVVPEDDDAVYYNVAMLRGARGNANVQYVGVLVFDDVGGKIDRGMVDILMPVPTYVVETSPENFHYGWAIKGGCNAAEFRALRVGRRPTGSAKRPRRRMWCACRKASRTETSGIPTSDGCSRPGW